MASQLDRSLERGRDYLLSEQHLDGYWAAELSCDASVTAESLYLRHLLGRVDEARQDRAVCWLKHEQNEAGGWPLFAGGPCELNATVKCYLALKLSGLDPDTPELVRARGAIARLGGIEGCHLFTKIYLAWGGLYPWDRLPRIPIEILLLPNQVFSRYDLSYWARTILVPLLVTLAKRPVFPVGIDLSELPLGSLTPSNDSRMPWWQRAIVGMVEGALDGYGRHAHPVVRERALREAEAWILARFEGSDGLGAIWPAMVNAVVALCCLGHGTDSTALQEAIRELERLELDGPDGLRVQPCCSPVWDTAWAIKALVGSGVPVTDSTLRRAGEWLMTKQSLKPGDWLAGTDRDLEPGGWYFQHANAYYPDVDDTAVVLMALRQLPLSQDPDVRGRIERGINWIEGMQNRDGGWGAFDRTPRRREWLNLFSWARPFDGALLDPSTADVTARCIEALGKFHRGSGAIARKAIRYLSSEQEADGSWYGRWGVNYLYGTWSVLCGLQACGVPPSDPAMRRAVAYLKATQLSDGGWGETCQTYCDPSSRGQGPSTPSQTAWALMALLAASEGHSIEAGRAYQYLVTSQSDDGSWPDQAFTGTGFPRVFYLRYGMYGLYFPLLALGRYRIELLARRSVREVPV